MSSTSSLNSSASRELLPANQESLPAQPFPAEIVLHLEEPEDPTVAVDLDDVVDEVIDAQVVMDNMHTRVFFPRVLLDVIVPSPVGENILSLVLRHACITGYETSFKHGKKRLYLDTLHGNAFNADGILNQ